MWRIGGLLVTSALAENWRYVLRLSLSWILAQYLAQSTPIGA